MVEPSREQRRMIREGLAEQHIQTARELVAQCRESEEEIRSLHLHYGMTGLGRLERLKGILESLEPCIETARQEHLPIRQQLTDTAHLVREEILFWSEEIRKAFEEA